MLRILKKTKVASANTLAMLCKYANAIVCRQTQIILKHRVVRIASGLTLIAIVSVLFVSFPKLEASNDGLRVHDDWRGTWEVTISYRDHTTGALIATDVTTDAICPGEPIVPRLLNTVTNLQGTANESELTLMGQAKYSPRPGCNVHTEVTLDSQRDGDTWTGTGSWAARNVGTCEHLDYGEDFVISGRRLRMEPACDSQNESLLQRFFTNGLLSPVLAGRE